VRAWFVSVAAIDRIGECYIVSISLVDRFNIEWYCTINVPFNCVLVSYTTWC